MENKEAYINAIVQILLTVVRSACEELTVAESKELAVRLCYAINMVLYENKIFADL